MWPYRLTIRVLSIRVHNDCTFANKDFVMSKHSHFRSVNSDNSSYYCISLCTPTCSDHVKPYNPLTMYSLTIHLPCTTLINHSGLDFAKSVKATKGVKIYLITINCCLFISSDYKIYVINKKATSDLTLTSS